MRSCVAFVVSSLALGAVRDLYVTVNTSLHSSCRIGILQGVRDVKTERWKGASTGLFVQTPCLKTETLGNSLTRYFEGLACAHLNGLTYVAASKVVDNGALSVPEVAFYEQLPNIIPAAAPFSSNTTQTQCSCELQCHGDSRALWVRASHIVKRILGGAVQSARAAVPTPPLIPDVAIHYRCSDNFERAYGFLPYRALLPILGQGPGLVYVLSEPRGRRVSEARAHLNLLCDRILQGLSDFLLKHAPQKRVVFRRGNEDAVTHLSLLALANTTVCSVSTFCLWAAVASNGTVYMPSSSLFGENLVALQKRQNFSNLRIMYQPAVIFAAPFVNKNAPIDRLFELLSKS